MTGKEKNVSKLLLDVGYTHLYESRKEKVKQVYLMHPTRATKVKVLDQFSIRKDSDTRLGAYVNDSELAELFSIDAFSFLGINLRMRPVGDYKAGSPPGLQPRRMDVVPGSQFESSVRAQGERIAKEGLSPSLYSKLQTAQIPLRQDLTPRHSEEVGSREVETPVQESNSTPKIQPFERNRRIMSIDELQANLDRRNAIGAQGERVAIEDESERLRSKDIGCDEPEKYVKHIALDDVGRGYDIESSFPGHERFIEVKSSTSEGNAIYMSDNEWQTLHELGSKAWIYRVIVDDKNSGQVVLRLNDPTHTISEDSKTTAVWRIQLTNDRRD